MAAPLVVGGIWAYRAYQAYRAAQAAAAAARAAQAAKAAAEALEAINAAQANANAESAEQDKAKTDAQAKADAATNCQGGNCDEDPDCETARGKLTDSLYGIKGDTSDTGRGLAERLCHWLHGTDEALRDSHLNALGQAADRVKKAREWLTGGGTRPYGKTEGARLTKEQKNKKLKDCAAPPESIKDSEELEKLARDISKGNSPIKPIPRADFAAACAKDALNLINKAFGR